MQGFVRGGSSSKHLFCTYDLVIIEKLRTRWYRLGVEIEVMPSDVAACVYKLREIKSAEWYVPAVLYVLSRKHMYFTLLPRRDRAGQHMGVVFCGVPPFAIDGCMRVYACVI